MQLKPNDSQSLFLIKTKNNNKHSCIDLLKNQLCDKKAGVELSPIRIAIINVSEAAYLRDCGIAFAQGEASCV